MFAWAGNAMLSEYVGEHMVAGRSCQLWRYRYGSSESLVCMLAFLALFWSFVLAVVEPRTRQVAKERAKSNYAAPIGGGRVAADEPDDHSNIFEGAGLGHVGVAWLLPS